MVSPLQKLDALTLVEFPYPLRYDEFRGMLDDIDTFVLPCEVNYEVVQQVKSGQRGKSGLTLIRHSYVKSIRGEITSYTDGQRAQFVANLDNDYPISTRVLGIKFDSAGYDAVEELEASSSSSVELMKRVRAGIEVYFGSNHLNW